MVVTASEGRSHGKGEIIVQVLRRIGIALGSFVIAWLAVSLVAGTLLGTNATGNVLIGLVTLVLGGLIYRDILRRERRPV